MSRTDLDATTIANSLRRMAGDGSMEWVSEPIQASVLLDIADMLDENAKLRELVESYGMIANEAVCDYYDRDEMLADANATACELGIEVDE